MGSKIEHLIQNPQVRINYAGWLILTYPQSYDAILILRTPIQIDKFLKDCQVTSIDQITDIPLKYYRLASRQISAKTNEQNHQED